MISSRALRAIAAAALSGCALVARGAATGDAAAGERLATARCVSCHSSKETMHSMLPLLEGQPKAAFIAQWRAFRERKRTAPVMVSLTEELSEQDVDDLAEYYAALLPPRAPDALSGSDVGRALAERLRCAECHGPTMQGTNAGAARLAGQKARYTAWSLQLMRGGTRAHGTAVRDPLLAKLSNDEIELLAAHFASLR